MRATLTAYVNVPIRLLLSYPLARSDNTVFMAAIVLVCGLLCSSGHEAAKFYGVFPTSSLSRNPRVLIKGAWVGEQSWKLKAVSG